MLRPCFIAIISKTSNEGPTYIHSIFQNMLDNNEPVISLYLYVEVQM